MAKKKSKLEHSVTQTGAEIVFVNTLTETQFATHESWLNGHGMTARARVFVAAGEVQIDGNEKKTVLQQREQITLTFKDKKSAEVVFNEIFGEGALDADDWDDDTIYAGGQTEGLAASLGTVAEQKPRMEKPKKAKRASKR